MRLLLASDLHYRLPQYDWIARVAAGFDAVAIAGDHLHAHLPVPVEVQVSALVASMGRIAARTQLLACSGNHDLEARNVAGEKVAGWLQRLRHVAAAVDGESATIGGILFTVCPWWDGPHARAAVESQLAAAAGTRRQGRPWVWLYHAPPPGPLAWNGRRDYGDPLLAELIARHQPSAVLCGHIHEAPFKPDGGWARRLGGTWVFNPGAQIGEQPAHIVIDFGAATAQWKSLAGVERIAL
jgi:Icc-related predicted phosphoesterase